MFAVGYIFFYLYVVTLSIVSAVCYALFLLHNLDDDNSQSSAENNVYAIINSSSILVSVLQTLIATYMYFLTWQVTDPKHLYSEESDSTTAQVKLARTAAVHFCNACLLMILLVAFEVVMVLPSLVYDSLTQNYYWYDVSLTGLCLSLLFGHMFVLGRVCKDMNWRVSFLPYGTNCRTAVSTEDGSFAIRRSTAVAAVINHGYSFGVFLCFYLNSMCTIVAFCFLHLYFLHRDYLALRTLLSVRCISNLLFLFFGLVEALISTAMLGTYWMAQNVSLFVRLTLCQLGFLVIHFILFFGVSVMDWIQRSDAISDMLIFVSIFSMFCSYVFLLRMTSTDLQNSAEWMESIGLITTDDDAVGDDHTIQ